MPSGGRREGSGRKSKAEELRVRDTAVSAITKKYGSLEGGFEALLSSGEASLIKWVFEHAAGKPQDKIDLTSLGEKIENKHEVIFRDYSKKQK